MIAWSDLTPWGWGAVEVVGYFIVAKTVGYLTSGCTAYSNSYNSRTLVIASGQAEGDLNARNWARVLGSLGVPVLRAANWFGLVYEWSGSIVRRWVIGGHNRWDRG